MLKPVATVEPASTRDVLLRRRGLVFVGASPASGSPDERALRGLELELAELGYVLATRLRARLATFPSSELARTGSWACGVLAKKAGAHVGHVPLFRRFPEDVPADTGELWWKKVLVHFLQGEDLPCLFCRQVGTTHVLSPCRHVVCDRCFDGSNYSGCPVCERRVDPGSPFFAKEPEPRGKPRERVRWKLLDLGEAATGGDESGEARRLVESFCARPQALSPTDRDDFAALLGSEGPRVLAWLPARIPLRENVALVFGTLARTLDPAAVLAVGRAHLKTATDVLRFLACYSGADPALQGETIWLRAHATTVKRFWIGKLRRPLRRAVLELLASLDETALTEDMLRHRSYWVWVGEHLHPHEHAKRFPSVARAFQVVRKTAPDGTPAPAFHGFASKVEAAASARDAAAMARLLGTRPGELARRLDHALRIAGEDEAARGAVVSELVAHVEALATPVLLTLATLLPTRTRPAPERVYWPKGTVAKGAASLDRRPTLSLGAIEPVVRALEAELLRRFALEPALDTVLVDASLARIAAPFNERTAARAAIALPRGSRVAVPPAKVLRLFLHWCEPEKNGSTTDLDLSVGFYDDAWKPVGVCSFYQLELRGPGGARIAASGGDLRAAPFPEGATELVDVHRRAALDSGARYAVMVANAYSGMAMSQLERAFAGIMLRDDEGGRHFDPRTVELRFDLAGENGIYLPLVLDLRESTLHWLDVYSRGGLAFNTAASSSAAIEKLCPRLMRYFESGVRTSMLDLVRFHAAARARRVIVRGEPSLVHVRDQGESAAAFLARLRSGAGASRADAFPSLGSAPLLAALHTGDLELPAGSRAFVLFPGKTAGSLAAADLLARGPAAPDATARVAVTP